MTSSKTNQIINPGMLVGFVGGCCAGAVTMLLLDPVRGNARRARVRDQGFKYMHLGQRKAVALGHDVFNRSRGLVARIRTRAFERRVDDDVLVARCASRLGRVVANPHPVELTADNGIVYVGGQIPGDQVARVIAELGRVPGVKEVRHSFEIGVLGMVA